MEKICYPPRIIQFFLNIQRIIVRECQKPHSIKYRSKYTTRKNISSKNIAKQKVEKLSMQCY